MKSKKVKIALGVAVLALLAVFLLRSKSTTVSNSSWPTNEQFVIGLSQEFEALNPIISQMVASTYINLMVLRPINMINEDWTWECHLCEEMPSLENGMAKIIKENGKAKKVQATFVIKEAAKWGDGKPVTGEDLKLAWDIGRSDNVAVGEKQSYLDIEKVDVDAQNPKRFTVTYSKPLYSFYKLTLANVPLVPAHLEQAIWDKTKSQPGAYEKQTMYSTDPLNPGLYNGPYVVSEIKLGSHVALVPNKFFYGKPANIKRIILKVIANTQTLEANLFSGTIDMISILGITFDQALTLEKRLKETPKYKGKFDVKYRQGLVYEHIDLNLRNPVLADIRVRKALMYALDRKKLTDALFEGQQAPALHSFHPLDEFYTDEVEKYNYEPAKAAALLDEAGWKVDPTKGGMRYKDGKKLTFTLMTTAQNKTREMVQVYLQSEWKKVGIDIVAKTEPARVYFGETVRKGKYDHMAMFAWVSSPDNPPRSILHSKMIPTAKNAYSGQNSGGWSNKEVDKALDDVEVEMDPDKRKELMKIVQKRYTEEVPTIPLYLRSDVAVLPTNLKNFKITGHQFSDAQRVELWDLDGAVAKKGI